MSEIETLLDERSADEGVLADTIATNQENHRKSSDFRELCAEVLQAHR